MNLSEFFDVAEDVVRAAYNTKSRWHPMALLWVGGNRVSFADLGEGDSDTEMPKRLTKLLIQKGVEAYAAAFEAVVTGSDAEVRAARHKVVLEHFGSNVRGLDDIPKNYDTDLIERVLYIFMAARQGTCRAISYPVVEKDRHRHLGKRDVVSREIETPYRDLYAHFLKRQ